MPDWKNIKIFALGALWAAICGLTSAGVMVADWIANWSNPIDWKEVAHVAAAGALSGVFGYWRKHKALLALPPGMEDATEFQKSAQQGDKSQ